MVKVTTSIEKSEQQIQSTPQRDRIADLGMSALLQEGKVEAGLTTENWCQNRTLKVEL